MIKLVMKKSAAVISWKQDLIDSGNKSSLSKSETHQTLALNKLPSNVFAGFRDTFPVLPLIISKDTSANMSDSLNRILESVSQIQHCCQPSVERNVTQLRPSGRTPQLDPPARNWLLLDEIWSTLPSPITMGISKIADDNLLHLRVELKKMYERTIPNLVSLKNLGGMSDFEAERQVCRIFEKRFQAHIHEIKKSVHIAVERYLAQQDEDTKQHTSSHSPVSSSQSPSISHLTSHRKPRES